MRIIGVSGKARSGKGEFARIAIEEFGATPVWFAKGVKEEVAEFLRTHNVAFEERHLYGEESDKEETLSINLREVSADFPEFWGFVSKFGKVVGSTCFFNARGLMQWYGTEYRRAQDPQYWVKQAMSKCTETGPKLYVIEDCRFENEAFAIREAGGLLVRIHRPGPARCSNPDHPSETALDDWTDWDIIIRNEGTLESYRNDVRLALSAVCAYDDLENA